MANMLTSLDAEWRYLHRLLEEQNRIALYVHELPLSNTLLNKEIARVSEIISKHDFNNFGGSRNLYSPLNIMPNVASLNSVGDSGWISLHHQGISGPQGPPVDHSNAVAASPYTLLTKKMLRLDVPVDRYPNFNFVGRLLGPRGNSLKRIQAFTGCRIIIRGRGSMKDANKEERLRRRQQYRHLNEPLHVVIEAVAPANEVDVKLGHAQNIILELLIPVLHDSYKRGQLRELARLNSRQRSVP